MFITYLGLVKGLKHIGKCYVSESVISRVFDYLLNVVIGLGSDWMFEYALFED